MERRPPAVAVAGPLQPAAFLERPNRFLVRARLDSGAVVEAHLADPGRLEELLVPERRLWLHAVSRDRAHGPARRTGWTALLVQTPSGGGLVSLDTTLPNRLVAPALRAGALPELGAWSLERIEVPEAGSRLDFLLRSPRGRRLLLEVKSVTRVEDGVGLFPDAVSARAARHVRALSAIVRRREADAAVLFVVQRSDAHSVAAARAVDPEFAEALDAARAGGVRLLARRCAVTLEQVALADAVPVV